ncbi:MAG: hypothetical protein E7609_01260 [Ruminococcaceae bacterium]|nr:hypothetical protein [Oscillospiraceae bacterium]
MHAVENRVALKKEFEAKRDARPLVVGRASAYAAKKDGIRKYKVNGNEYAVSKNGDSYALYDYKDKVVSNSLSLSELKNALSEYDTKHNNAQETTKDTENAAKEKTASEKEAAKTKREKSPVEKSYEIAKSKVAKYDKLSANDQSMIRKIIRQGIALGVREDVIVYAANIAARTHTDVVFNKDMCAVPTKDGRYIIGYANGAYIASEKRFYFNPEAQTTDGFIIHELDHAIRKRVGTDGGVTTKIFKKAIDAAGKDTYTEITKRYGTKTDVPKGKFIPGKTETTEQKISKTEDEVEAFYAETALKDKDILKHLLAEKPTIKQRILNFFKGALSDYASIPELDADAKKYYKQYRKWFAEFEKDQRGTQINTRSGGDGGDVRYSVDEDLLNFVNSVQNMQNKKIVSRRKYIISKLNDSHARLVESVFENELHKKIDLSGYSISIDGSTVSHIEEKHGKNGTSDHSMKDNKDVARVGWAVNNADNGYAARKQSGEIDYSSKYKNADGTLAPKIILEKEIGDEKIIVVECVPDASSKQVHIVSARKIKNGNGQVLNVESTDSPQPTSETLLDGISATDSVAQSTEKSNPSDEKSSKKSEKDSAGHDLTQEQAEYFKDSKVRDKEGNLRVMYQGAAEDFSVFDRKKSKPSNLYGRGFYFTDSVTNANLYGNARAFYLNITNPLSTDKRTITRIQMRKFLNAVAENEDYGIENYGTSDVGEVLASVYSGKSDFAMIQDVNATCIGDLVAAVELFNAVNGTSYDGFILPTESVTFQSAQAKLTSNKAPTIDPNISYSLPNDMDGAPIDYENLDSKWWIEYNEIKLPSDEQSRIQSEALTWDAKHRNVLRTRTLSTGITYRYVIDDDGIVHVFDRSTSKNIHEKGEKYDLKDRRQLDHAVESLRFGQGNDRSAVGALQDGRDAGEAYSSNRGSIRSQEGEKSGSRGENRGARNSNARSNAFYKKKVVEYKFTEGGHGTVRYSDGTVERFSLPSDFDPNTPLLDENGKPIPYESFVDRGVPYARSPEMNMGQMRKAIANAMHYKVYSKKAMLDIVKQFPGADLLHAATRDKIADSMWQSFNSFKTTEEAESYIRDMARYILSVSMKEAKVQKPVSDDAQRRFEYMRAYVNGLTFTKSDLEDIKSAKGEDGYKRIIGRWGYKARKNGKEHKTPILASFLFSSFVHKKTDQLFDQLNLL